MSARHLQGRGVSSSETLLAALHAGPLLDHRDRIEALVAWLVDLLDRMDGEPDAEPDHDGEREPDEASAHPAMLYVERVPVRQGRYRHRTVNGGASGGELSAADGRDIPSHEYGCCSR